MVSTLCRLALTGLLLAAFVPHTQAQGQAQGSAQGWPNKPLRVIVSQAAGGTPDIICRLVMERLSRALGQQIVVDNRPGGGNVIGAQAAARAEPDGYNFFFATAAPPVAEPLFLPQPGAWYRTTPGAQAQQRPEEPVHAPAPRSPSVPGLFGPQGSESDRCGSATVALVPAKSSHTIQ